MEICDKLYTYDALSVACISIKNSLNIIPLSQTNQKVIWQATS